MKFTETPLQGAYVIDLDTIEDERGFFARSWCRKEFADHGLIPDLVQCNISFNKKKGTLRGMHFQTQPYGETKLVRCTQGAVHDVIIDLRANSPTFKKWHSVELTARNRTMLYIPADFAHGFQTLEDNTEIMYQMSEYYHPDHARGVRWNDPVFSIAWPVNNQIVSERDREYTDFQLCE